MAVADSEDLYGILGLEKGPESTLQDIKKAHRVKAKEYHPDKNAGDKVAADLFLQIQRAYEILSDEQARKAYDAVVKIAKERAQRESKRSDKRQRMLDELRAKERVNEREVSEEKAAKARLKAEIERMQRQMREKRERELKERAGSMVETATVSGEAESAVGPSDRDRTLRATWTDDSAQEPYTADRLKEMFSECGTVEDIVVSQGKKGKWTALIVMGTVEAAKAATERVMGYLSNPLLVKSVNPLAFDRPKAAAPPSAAAGAAANDVGGGAGVPSFGVGSGEHPRADRPGVAGEGKFPSFGAGSGGPVFGAAASAAVPRSTGVVGAAFRDYESLTMMKLRQAQERARLIREMAEEDQREAEMATKACESASVEQSHG